jgi:hypothetical protein
MIHSKRNLFFFKDIRTSLRMNLTDQLRHHFLISVNLKIGCEIGKFRPKTLFFHLFQRETGEAEHADLPSDVAPVPLVLDRSGGLGDARLHLRSQCHSHSIDSDGSSIAQHSVMRSQSRYAQTNNIHTTTQPYWLKSPLLLLLLLLLPPLLPLPLLLLLQPPPLLPLPPLLLPPNYHHTTTTIPPPAPQTFVH